ncbi:CoA-binding protein [Fusibacter paucivorans]|uniref:CoA-binding protein n=1 Tax=Fusibacter paucivorans TaxID=76009 RepID=A0ABS5PMT6_9FIRM|nr:CoA-binding protein [Fusibacter paucivorans]
MNEASINAFFTPRGVAIIGASARQGSPSNQILKYSKEMSLTGNVFPVNPTAKEIEGLKCYGSLLEIPETVDLVVISVGASKALNVAYEIKERREAVGDAGAVAIVSAGFKELGTEEAIALQDEMIATIKSCGARVIGPNCQGVVDIYNGINTTFSVPPVTLKGGLTIISQSGAFATSYLRWAKDHKLVGINKFVTLGNMADVDVTETLAFMADDERTKVIAMYLEGTTDARKLMDVAKSVTSKKPIVAIKAGRTAAGSNVAHSHTASIAGDDNIYDGAFKQVGIIRANTIAEFYHTGRVFDKMPIPKGNRICILTVVGGPSTICVDALTETGEAQLAHFSDELVTSVQAVLSGNANVGNPDGYIDMTASITPVMHKDALALLMADDSIDGIIFITTPPGFIGSEDLAKAIEEGYNAVPEEKRKPLFSVLMAGNAVGDCRVMLEEKGFPTFEYPDEAARVMINMIRYSNYLKHNGVDERM